MEDRPDALDLEAAFAPGIRCTPRVVGSLDGTELFVRHWQGETASDRTLVIAHGAGEHGGRYEHLAARFVRRGWDVIAADARGHGRSQGIPTHVVNFDQYVLDFSEVLRRTSPKPERTALFAHSMGGLIAARLLETSQRPVCAAAILSSPLLALQLRVPAMKLALGRICSWIAPQARFATEIRPDHLNRSEWAIREREEDPHHHKSVTAGWYFQVLDAMVDAWSEAAAVNVPILLQQGDADEVVNADGCLDWWSRLSISDRQFRLLAGHLHELACEPTWRETADFICDWLEPRIPGRAMVVDAG